ncbi:lysoplasmalogenase [Oceanobacillus sp. J11TS1]|uniref:lysoplasmalogenase n=1 Tax=Oceanobacillus sp. J11TS1 TaxID=2807191 RepID=UPI001AFEB5EA|nr:lysoplasmalogenase [Oceanobacillus sp. J11TS1]GIO24612.1 membrane protein [Oceanobacillus sp. J11TS1]
MILYRLPILILTTGIVYIFISPSEPLAFSIFFKIIPMVLILIYAFEQSLPKRKATHYWIIAALTFCMIGDATIHWFLIGLTAFLIGHVLYTIGFLQQWRFSFPRSLSAIPLLLFAIWIGYQLVDNLQENGETMLILPVIAYIGIILFMAFTAIMTGNRWAILGSILFIISDSALAWNMFISSFTAANEVIMITYYSAQFLLAHCLFTIDPTTHKGVTW